MPSYVFARALRHILIVCMCGLQELMRREEVSVDASPRPGKRRRIDDRQDGDGKDGADGDAPQEDQDADMDWTELVHDASEWAVELDHM